jgi:hypothetical protein
MRAMPFMRRGLMFRLLMSNLEVQADQRKLLLSMKSNLRLLHPLVMLKPLWMRNRHPLWRNGKAQEGQGKPLSKLNL